MQLFGAKVKFARSTLLLAGGSLAFVIVATVFAQPYAQSSQTVRITRFEVFDDKTDQIRSVFSKGAKLRIEAEFTDLRNLAAFDDDDPNYDANYVVVFEIREGSRPVYSTDDTLEGNKDLQLEPEERKKMTFRWDAPFEIDSGGHEIVITVRDANNFSNVQDEVKSKITIQSSAAALYISKLSVDFGDVEDDDTPRERILVSNPNRAAGDLIWKITGLPDWLELISPEASENDSQESVLVTNNHTIILQVRGTVLKGNLKDQLKIESNAGTSRIDVSVSVDRNANGLMSQLKVRNAIFKPGQDVPFLYRVQNDGEIPMTYSVTFLVESPTGSLYYNSSAEGLDAIVGPIFPGKETDSLTFIWTIPYGSFPGEYQLGAVLRAYPAREFLFDDVPFPADSGGGGSTRGDEIPEGDTFEVERGALIAVAPLDWAFGAVTEGETDSASFAVSNRGRGALEWTVVSWPDWLELESPTETVSGRDTIEVSISRSAPPGNYSGAIEIESTGGPKSIKVSVRLVPLPTPTVGIATVLARLIPTATPEPTATPRPAPTATRTPAPLQPLILSGKITVRNGGSFPDDAKLVAKIGDYTSQPAARDGDTYSSLVVIPPDRTSLSQPIELYLGDTPAILSAPLYFFQGGTRRLDLTFAALPTATAVPKPEPTPTVGRAVETSTAIPVPPSVTATATAEVAVSKPEPEQTSTPQVFITAESGDSSEPSVSGGCNATAGQVGWISGLTNSALLIMPIGLLAVMRGSRKRRRRSEAANLQRR